MIRQIKASSTTNQYPKNLVNMLLTLSSNIDDERWILNGDVFEEGDYYKADVKVHGLLKEKLFYRLYQHILYISGFKNVTLNRSRVASPFVRKMLIPSDAKPESTKLTIEDEMLLISIKKARKGSNI